MHGKCDAKSRKAAYRRRTLGPILADVIGVTSETVQCSSLSDDDTIDARLQIEREDFADPRNQWCEFLRTCSHRHHDYDPQSQLLLIVLILTVG